MVLDLKGRTYEDRLTESGLTTLEDRRFRGDMVSIFRIMSGVDASWGRSGRGGEEKSSCTRRTQSGQRESIAMRLGRAVVRRGSITDREILN